MFCFFNIIFVTSALYKFCFLLPFYLIVYYSSESSVSLLLQSCTISPRQTNNRLSHLIGPQSSVVKGIPPLLQCDGFQTRRLWGELNLWQDGCRFSKRTLLFTTVDSLFLIIGFFSVFRTMGSPKWWRHMTHCGLFITLSCTGQEEKICPAMFPCCWNVCCWFNIIYLLDLFSVLFSLAVALCHNSGPLSEAAIPPVWESMF